MSKELENPKFLRLHDELNDKYSDKADYEESDVTAWTGVTVFIIHSIIAAITVSVVAFLDISKVEKVVFGVLLGIGAICLESFKSRYMERFFVAFLKANNPKLPKNVRQLNDKKAVTNRTILVAFWSVSLFIFVISGIKYANVAAGTAQTLTYDSSIKAVLDQKTKALEAARLNGAGSITLRRMADDLNKASQDWQRHTAAVDAQNNNFAGEHENSVWFYALCAVGLCFLFEGLLVAMRGFHEKTQYKIAMSLQDALGTETKQPEKLKETVEMIEKRFYDELLDKYKKLIDSDASVFSHNKDLKAKVKELEKQNEALMRLVK